MGKIKKWGFFVVLPTLLALIYFGLIASDMYVSESRFSIRSQEGGGSVELLAFFGQAAGGTGRDAHIVQQFIESPELLNTLDDELQIKKHYQNPEADRFSRLGKEPTREEFLKYFLRQVTLRYDQVSGILEIKVRAFTPQVAQQICQAVLAESEALVNRLSKRAIEDSLTLSRDELTRSEQRLVAVRQKMRQFRQANKLLDPVVEAGAVQGIVAELEGSAVRVRTELAEMRSYMQESSSKVVSLNARIQALDDQIIKEKIRLTGTDQDTVSSLAAEYEQLQLEHEFAQKQFFSAMTSLEASRIHAESQSRYVVAFIEPTLPEESLWPRRMYSIGVSFSIVLLVFSLGSLILAAIREHAGV